MNNGFLPVSRAEMEERGIKQFDFVYVIGDAYVDHPSFGHAIISRLLEAHGYSVGIISQPDWRDKESVCIFGEPRLGFLVSAGNMDSMVNHYSVSKKRRATDAFTPGGVMGKRPDYATIVYCNLLRQTYKHTPIIIGGIEASLRRLAHYDYWSNKMKRSILLDSGADLISYGMGEHSIVEIADALNSGLAVSDITFIDGTVYKTRKREDIYDAIELPHYEEVLADKAAYARSFYTQYCNTDPFVAKRLFETYDGKLFVVQNPPAKPLTQSEMDQVRISARIIRVTKRRAGFLQSRKCVFLWSATAAATEDAVSVRLRSIRDGLFRCAATSPFWRRRRRSSGNRTLRDTSMMSAGRRPISARLHVTSR